MIVNKTIEKLGGRLQTAESLGISYSAVSKWFKNGIPPKHWAKIVSETNGVISYDDLSGGQK